jgi:hypothetical protein
MYLQVEVCYGDKEEFYGTSLASIWLWVILQT